MTDIDIERFKQTILASSEVEIDFTELIQNIHINKDGNIESYNKELQVIMTPEYEIVMMAGGISPEQNQKMIDQYDKDECDI